MNRDTVLIDYTNHRGERRWRRITPDRIEFTSSFWHRNDGHQWILHALDDDTKSMREFAMKDIHGWKPV